MQPAGSVALVAAGEPGAEVFVTRGAGEEAHGEGAEVEASAAGDDGRVAACGDLAHGLTAPAGIFSGGEGFVGVGDVDEVMGEAALFFGGGFG